MMAFNIVKTTMETVEHAVSIAADNGIPVILDPAPGRKLSTSLIEKLYCIKPNETEAEILTEIAVTDDDSARKAGEKLLEFGENLYRGEDPTQIFFKQKPYQFAKMDGQSVVKLHLPFVSKKEIDLSKIGDELIIKIGNFKKNIVLPRAYAVLEPRKARLEEDYLLIEFGGSSE